MCQAAGNQQTLFLIFHAREQTALHLRDESTSLSARDSLTRFPCPLETPRACLEKTKISAAVASASIDAGMYVAGPHHTVHMCNQHFLLLLLVGACCLGGGAGKDHNATASLKSLAPYSTRRRPRPTEVKRLAQAKGVPPPVSSSACRQNT